MVVGMRGRLAIVFVVLIAVLLVWNYLRPVPAAAATLALAVETTIPGTPPALPWPAVGSGAVGVSGLGELATSGDAQPIPAASVTKVMTALIVLTDRPLAAGESGPSITITQQDVQAYESDRAQQQSVVLVRAGETLTEHQALEAMLIPSGNNIAETLARWDGGSIAAFVAKMNERAKALGLTRTTFADPAGANPGSTSVPSDLMALGMAAMHIPAFAQIVSLPSAQIPVAGAVFNVNAVLGKDGIVGIKTGSGFNLGANFLFAAQVQVNAHAVTIFGCVMGQPTLDAAFSAARALVRAMVPALSVKKILARNQAVGSYTTAWGDRSDVLSTIDVLVVQWPGLVMRDRLDAPVLNIAKPVNPGAEAGKLHVLLGDYALDVPLVTASALYPAGRLWRVTRLPGQNS
ncbi:MAG TPA: D-alanyl-D-alanine carboxypeptidase [Chloroflexota bacterium]